MLLLYLIIETILLLSIFLATFFAHSRLFLDVLRFLPILFNLLFITIFKSNLKLILATLLSTAADFFFLLVENTVLGVIFYIGVQLFYRFYMEQKIDFKLLFIWFLLLVNSLLFGKLFLLITAPIYVTLFIKNIHIAFKRYRKKEDEKTFITALILLFLCDTTIALKTIFKKRGDVYLLFDCIEWTVYILSQVALVVYAQRKRTASAA